ncbi:MAG: hypothetical protein ACXVCY_15535 [Pseudobdellovibrionaceae bacterium]
MLKKICAGLGTSLFIFSAIPAFADDTQGSDAKAPMTQSEASLSNIIIGNLLNSIETASVDFEIEDASLKSGEGLSINALKLSGLVKLNSDLSVNLGKTQETGGSQLNKVMPKIEMDSKNIFVNANVDKSAQGIKFSLEFYDRFDSKKKQWISRPLTFSVNNQLNKSLLKIKFNWVIAKVIMSQNPQQPNIVKGTCSSEKLLLDITTGLNRPVPVDCEFEGTYSEKGYNINFKYVSVKSNPALGAKP